MAVENVELWQIGTMLGAPLNNCLTENGKKLSGYDIYDRFITNYDLFVPAKEAAQCVNWEDALAYIKGKGLIDEFFHLYIAPTIKENLLAGKGFAIETDALHKDLKDYVTQNEDAAGLFFKWLWHE